MELAQEAFMAPAKTARPATTLMAVHEAMSMFSPNENALANIQSLKAYAMAANDIAQDAVEDHPNAKKSALTLFITAFGEEPPSDTLVGQYATTMGTLRVEFDHKGLPDYLLDHLQEAVLGGEGVVTTQAGKTKYNYAVLGFDDEPSYIADLAVRSTAYSSALVEVQSKSTNADEEAALQCLQAGMIQKFKNFLGQIQDKYKKKAEEYYMKAVKGAESSIQSNYSETHDTHTLPDAGFRGAAAAIDAISNGEGYDMPTEEAMEAEAKKLATEWSSTQKSACSEIETDVEHVEDAIEMQPTCSQMSGKYGSDGSVVVAVDKASVTGTYAEGGGELSGTVTNVTDKLCSGTGKGPMTSSDPDDTETVSHFEFNADTGTITWTESGIEWAPYVEPAKPSFAITADACTTEGTWGTEKNHGESC
jgi:hypothetical protein